jgi:hypothetical protein
MSALFLTFSRKTSKTSLLRVYYDKENREINFELFTDGGSNANKNV